MDIIKAHKFCSNHKIAIKNSKLCGCFDCLEIFPPEKIKEWIDKSQTAMCPFCHIDSVLPENEGYEINHSFLKEMNEYWFSYKISPSSAV